MGDGKSIKIQGDKWLPIQSSRSVISPISSFSPDFMVCNLIDDESQTWKTDLLKKEFLPHEASIIVGLPLSINQTPDKQVWFPSNLGIYSTRSAYQMLAKSERGHTPNYSNMGRGKNVDWNLELAGPPQGKTHAILMKLSPLAESVETQSGLFSHLS